jgi:chemotaxis protein MotB
VTHRNRRHEEHGNHEAWAIPYGDLITLLLAFFVVMYAMSSVNEGKYRILSDSLNAAFQGAPRTPAPAPVGATPQHVAPDAGTRAGQPAVVAGLASAGRKPIAAPGGDGRAISVEDEARLAASRARAAELARIESAVQNSLADLIRGDVVAVSRNESFVEVSIRTDMLFASGSAELASAALAPLRELSQALAPLPNHVRVEGHTDDRPINTIAFPSNWELSAARAASVVRVLRAAGIAPERLAVVGLAEFRPVAANDSGTGRNANRRVALVIPATSGAAAGNTRENVTPVTVAARVDPPQRAGTVRAP